jgi:hypothetical protein
VPGTGGNTQTPPIQIKSLKERQRTKQSPIATMSYGGNNSYSRPNLAEYGGGGSVGANYYDTGADFSDQPQQRIYQQEDGRSDNDFHQAVHQAKQHHGEDADSDHTSLFSQAIGFISEHKDRFSSEEIDEGQVVSAHKTLYGGGGGGEEGTGQHDADTLGAGAALQALKMFTSGEGGGGGGGGHDQNKLIGMAMAQAGKLWDQQNKHGNVVSVSLFLFFFSLVLYLFVPL